MSGQPPPPRQHQSDMERDRRITQQHQHWKCPLGRHDADHQRAVHATHDFEVTAGFGQVFCFKKRPLKTR